MQRITNFELITDIGYFNPLQLQPRFLLSASFNGLSRWLREHLVSFPRLIRDEKFSVVILGSSIRYEQPLGFFDGDVIYVQASLIVQRGGTRAQLDTEFSGSKGIAAKVRILLCPVEVVDSESLGANPAPFPGRILERFHPDLARRVIRSVVVDSHHTTENQLLELAREFCWRTVQEIERVQTELELANRAVFELSEKVRKRWA